MKEFIMDEELNDYISYVINQLSEEYPVISKSINFEANKIHGLKGMARKIQKLHLLKHKHPFVMERLLSLLNRKFRCNLNINYKTCTIYNSPYLLKHIKNEPLDGMWNAFMH